MQKNNTADILPFFCSRTAIYKSDDKYLNKNTYPARVFLLIALFLAVLFMNTTSVHAAYHYVRAGATGANNGSDWTNAYTLLPATLVRGDTYYIADGSYGSYTFDDAVSGSLYIYVKKATGTDHGTDMGWNSTYGDGTAIFTAFYISTNYIDVDGQVGQWAEFLPNYVPYGIKVASTTSGENQRLISIGNSSGGRSYIVLKHIEVTSLNTPRTGTWHKGQHGVWGYGTYWTIQYCWIHDVGSLPIFAVAANYGTIDMCAVGRNGHDQIAMNYNPSEHSELLMLQPGSSNWIIKYSYFYDWRSTGNWVLYGGNNNTVFHGNIVFTTGYWGITNESGDSDGILQACMHGDTFGACQNTTVINNTFVNIPYGGRVASMTTGDVSGLKIENNIFYNVKTVSTGKLEIAGIDYRRYNSYYNVGPITNETGQQNGSGNPFINSGGYDFRLNSETNAGLTWGSPYNIDRAGNIRGSDGTWDRGAFEFPSQNPVVAIPNPPSNLQIQ